MHEGLSAWLRTAHCVCVFHWTIVERGHSTSRNSPSVHHKMYTKKYALNAWYILLGSYIHLILPWRTSKNILTELESFKTIKGGKNSCDKKKTTGAMSSSVNTWVIVKAKRAYFK